MFLAHLATATGPMTLGLIDIAQEDMEGPFNALINMLAQVSDPIEFTSTDTFIREVPPDTPESLTFKYLGARSAERRSGGLFGASMNEHLSCGVFQCPAASRRTRPGRSSAEFECLELIGEDTQHECGIAQMLIRQRATNQRLAH